MKAINLLLIGMILASLFIIPSALALSATNLTIQVPLASGTINGSVQNFNATLDSVIPIERWVNATVWVRSSTPQTANGTAWVSLGTFRNNTIIGFNGTINTLILEDGNDYDFNITLSNGTALVSKYNSNIRVENSVPLAPSSVSPTSSTSANVAFSATVIGKNTTSCKLIFIGNNPGSTQYNMTHSANSCTLTVTNVPNLIYNYLVQASDENDNTNSSQVTLTQDSKLGGSTGAVVSYIQSGGEIKSSTTGKTLSIADFTGKAKENPAITFFIIIAVVVGLVVFLNRK